MALTTRRARIWLALASTSVLCAACAADSPAAGEPVVAARAPRFHPTATVQEVMDAIVDPAADDIWDAVATTVTVQGAEEHRPQTDEAWLALRRRVIDLAEATNLLVIDGRRVARAYVPPDGPGVLDSIGVQARLDRSPEAFAGFAFGLHEAALQALAAVDARDANALLKAGGRIDAACERCHQAYWYPDQKIPSPASAGRARPSPSN
jgi:hypothetical protein